MRVAKETGSLDGTFKRRLLTLGVSLVLVLGVAVSESSAQLYGNGTDGPHTVVGTEDLTADKNYTDLTVPSGTVLETHGFTIRVTGTLTNAGTITDSYSGGTGGIGGTYGLGGTSGPGQPGVTGTPGNPGATGGGVGGDAGGGGGGGGGALDSDDSELAPGGRGGQGGDGGQGGGAVTIFCRVLNNTGVIHTNGFNGGNGEIGQPGAYRTYTETFFADRDLAGGGGGGGGGGQGGNGGTINIVYETLVAAGAITASGGTGGNGAPGGAPVNTTYSSGGSTVEFPGGAGGNFMAIGGSGGRGEIDAAASDGGATGQHGPPGSPGFVFLTPSSVCYVDNDGDGYGNAASPGTEVPGSCGAGFASNNFDCNDGDFSTNPGATEIPGDGVDQNCDGFDACYADSDVDGYGGSTVVTGIDLTCTGVGESPTNTDCNDADPSVNPGASEIPDDHIDQNCDGADDVTCYADLDADGYGDSTNSSVFPGVCGVGYLFDLTDNCPNVFNPAQTDTDGDQIGDACDLGCCLSPTVGDCDQSGVVDITDISILIDNQFLTLTPLVCDQEGDVDISGVVDITDVSILIDNQFLTLTPLLPCP